MDKTIYFHIGTVKTGSTMIQKFCHYNAPYLEANDLSYPHITPPELHLPRYTNASFIWREDIWGEAEATLRSIEQSRILISEEGLMGAPSKLKLHLFDKYRRKSIVYLRPPADLVAAWAAEKCKPYNVFTDQLNDKDGIFSIEKGIKRMMYDYEICMEKVIDVLNEFDLNDVIVRQYNYAKFKNESLLRDFFSIFEIDVPIFDVARVNVSPTRKYCDISYMVFSIVRELGVIEYYNHSLVDEIYKKCRSGDDRSVLNTLPDSTIEAICGRLKHIDQQFSDKFLSGREIFENRFPQIFHNERSDYAPVDRSEVEYLTRIAINLRFI